VLATLPIPILLALLAQAETAPADTTAQPADEAASAPTPEPGAGAEPAPASEPPPAAPAPAKPEPEQSPAKTPASQPNMMFGFRAGADFQLSGDVSPKVGYSFSPFVQYTYARLADRLGLGVRAEFTFDRFQKLVTVQADMGVDQTPQPYQTTRTLSFFDFALLATATLHVGRLQPWVAAGMGLALGNFDSPEAAYQPGDFRTTRPLVLGAGGLDLAVGRGALVGLHVEYRNMLSKPSFLANRIEVFGDRLSVQAGLMYQF
jgi:hypothetical protein